MRQKAMENTQLTASGKHFANMLSPDDLALEEQTKSINCIRWIKATGQTTQGRSDSGQAVLRLLDAYRKRSVVANQ